MDPRSPLQCPCHPHVQLICFHQDLSGHACSGPVSAEEETKQVTFLALVKAFMPALAAGKSS